MNLIKLLLIVIVCFTTVDTPFYARNSKDIVLNNLEETFFISEDEALVSIKILIDSGKYEEALQKLNTFIDKAKSINNKQQLIEGYMLLSTIFREHGDYKKSTNTFNKVIPFVLNDPEKLQYIYFKKGGNFQLDNQIDSAKVNYEKAVIEGYKVERNEDLKAKIYANLSGIFYLQANYDKAIENYKIAANYQDILGNKDIEAGILNNLGSVYYMQEKYKEALDVFQQAFDLVGFGQGDIQKQTRRSSYINMAYAYSGLKNYKKAFEYQDKFFSLNDSIQQELKYKEIAVIQSQYSLATKERETEIEKAKRKDAEILTYGLGLAVLILLSGIYALYKVYRLNKKNYQLKISQTKLLNQNKIDKIKSDLQLEILAATLDGRLEERKNIASVLHDNVSALLSAINLHLYASKKKIKGTIPVEIDKAQSILSEASEQVRDLSHNLMSAVLLKFGLEVAVQDLCEKLSNSNIILTSNSKNIGRFNQTFEIKMFTVINELLNNILKHSEASNGTVKLEQLNGNLQVVVFDDGIGFDIDEIEFKSGVGLSQIKARIQVLKGLLNIKSTEDGTRIFISVPIVY
ncbi:tetratricopeptide repeat protein [Lutibacter sp. A64]|uniref:tetratricopeptide repeat-containing sensor histidine kinase n=1 Tax=Lutibacter sp. A64 TaxID=2918526 RepID=UPI001F056321|nr:tetratricopeptide repeat protein [Lutibacter sp. A64]UMB53655.1 tetratricopeptide repeat protein [Lutibacter sp. A64]